MNSKWILTIVSAFLTLSLLGQFQQVNIGQAVINYIEKGTGDPVIFPELRAPLRNIKNAFRPWEKLITG